MNKLLMSALTSAITFGCATEPPTSATSQNIDPCISEPLVPGDEPDATQCPSNGGWTPELEVAGQPASRAELHRIYGQNVVLTLRIQCQLGVPGYGSDSIGCGIDVWSGSNVIAASFCILHWSYIVNSAERHLDYIHCL